MHFGWITRAALCSLLALATLTLGLWLGLLHSDGSRVRVVFLSVGQGDAILIQSGHQQVLVDSGREGTALLAALGREMPFYDRTIDVVIATHPDADHIGGFPTLLDRYQVGQFITTGATSDTSDWTLLERSLAQHQVRREIPGRSGVSIELAQGGRLTLLYPKTLPLPENLESNEGSIVARFEFGETSFLLTGDLPYEEDFLPMVEPADVLKAAHHGSRSSTSDAWLALVQPREAIISVGENRYGHPTGEVLDRLAKRGVAIFRTDELGSIGYRCLAERRQCFREE